MVIENETFNVPSPTKPLRRLPRSPSDPIHSIQHHNRQSGEQVDRPPPQPSQIYVLSADGSSLFLLDPSKPEGHEEPPPYASFQDSALQLDAEPAACSEITDGDDGVGGPSSPRSSRTPFPSGSIILHDDHIEQERDRRRRASTLPTQRPTVISPTRPTVRTHASFSRASLRPEAPQRTRSTRSSPGTRTAFLPDEQTPLLGDVDRADGESWVEIDVPRERGLWRSVFCGEVDDGEETRTWGGGWRRFWRPVGQGRVWTAMCHLWFINFPFALLVWPPLLVGTLVGTALLITLPLGAVVWWITLFTARSSARFEIVTQLHHHAPLNPSIPPPTYRPIFYRIRERSPNSLPNTPIDESPPTEEIVWEKRFLKCSYAMFADHFSYSALSYFLLIKPLIVLMSTIALIILFPVMGVTIFGLPIYLRAARRWGKYQAGVAIENL